MDSALALYCLLYTSDPYHRHQETGNGTKPMEWFKDSETGSIRKNVVRWRYKLVPGLLYSMCIFVSQICQLGSQLCVLNTTYINIHQTPYSHTAQQNMLAWHHHNFIPTYTSIHCHQPRAACSKMAKSPFRDIHLTAMAYHHVQSDFRRSRHSR